jgi:hypothetical protein
LQAFVLQTETQNIEGEIERRDRAAVPVMILLSRANGMP